MNKLVITYPNLNMDAMREELKAFEGLVKRAQDSLKVMGRSEKISKGDIEQRTRNTTTLTVALYNYAILLEDLSKLRDLDPSDPGFADKVLDLVVHSSQSVKITKDKQHV